MGQDVNAKLAQLLLDREAKLRRIDVTGTVNAHIGGHGGLAAQRFLRPSTGGWRTASVYSRVGGEVASDTRDSPSHPCICAGNSAGNACHAGLGRLDHFEPVVQACLQQVAVETTSRALHQTPVTQKCRWLGIPIWWDGDVHLFRTHIYRA